MQVIATKPGFYGGVRRREGDLFEVGAKEQASWFRSVDSQPDVDQARAEIKAAAAAEKKARGDGVAKAKAEAVAEAKAEAEAKAADDLV